MTNAEKKQQVLIIHGGTSYKDREDFLEGLRQKQVNLEWIVAQNDWKDYLPENLGEDFVVYAPSMPNKQNAQYEEWKIMFEKIFTLLDENPILIGHSLGGIFLAKYLSENTVAKKIKKTFLVAAPLYDDLEGEGLYSFAHTGDLQGLHKQGGEIYIYHSEDDYVVPCSHGAGYHEALPGSILRSLKDLGHLKVPHIPGLIEDIKK